MVIPEVLHALGLAACSDSVLLDVEGAGERWVLAVPWKTDLDWIALRDRLDCDPPLYRQHADSIYWYRYLPDSRTVYIHYRACAEMKDRPFDAFAAEVLDFIDNQQVDRVTLDLRYNGGGNSAIAQPLIRGLSQRDEFAEEGRLFVIIGRRTFSSALLNSLDLRDNTGALFVGEDTGGKPNHFGEVGFFVLKGCGAIVTYSKKHFVRYETDEPSLSPDIEVDISFSDYIACRDPVLQTILDYK
jgi:C-terminal processing protease CtpA/Prc